MVVVVGWMDGLLLVLRGNCYEKKMYIISSFTSSFLLPKNTTTPSSTNQSSRKRKDSFNISTWYFKVCLFIVIFIIAFVPRVKKNKKKKRKMLNKILCILKSPVKFQETKFQFPLVSTVLVNSLNNIITSFYGNSKVCW